MKGTEPTTASTVSPILEELLKPYPPDVRLLFREALARLRIVNKDDPILELMHVLGLWGVYYQKISGQIVTTGGQIKGQNEEALASLDDRVRLLQGLAQMIQQATDRLGTAGAEIVRRFPVEAIARQVASRVDAKISTMPIENFEEKVSTANQSLRAFAALADKLEAGVKRVESCAKRLDETPLPRISWWWSVSCIGLGVVLTLGGVWLFKTRPEMERTADFLRNEYYIGRRAISGMQEDGRQVIIVSGQELDTYQRDSNGTLTVWLKAKE